MHGGGGPGAMLSPTSSPGDVREPFSGGEYFVVASLLTFDFSIRIRTLPFSISGIVSCYYDHEMHPSQPTNQSKCRISVSVFHVFWINRTFTPNPHERNLQLH